jgi:hypothetical protein
MSPPGKNQVILLDLGKIALCSEYLFNLGVSQDQPGAPPKNGRPQDISVCDQPHEFLSATARILVAPIFPLGAWF